MKRYLIPILGIVLIGTATYFWTSRVSTRKAMLAARHAHLDSLKMVQSRRLATPTAVDTNKALSPIAQQAQTDADTVLKLSDLWATKHYSAIQDSIRPQDFADSSVHYFLSLENGESGEGDGVYLESIVYPDGGGSPTGFDTIASRIEQRNYWFVRNTVMAMLYRYLKNNIKEDEFSRCPSGYFFNTVDEDNARLHLDPEWDTGTVYFDLGCDDTALCDYRFNYVKRIVEMKDINSNHFVSLREYELAKFSEYAEVRQGNPAQASTH